MIKISIKEKVRKVAPVWIEVIRKILYKLHLQIHFEMPDNQTLAAVVGADYKQVVPAAAECTQVVFVVDTPVAVAMAVVAVEAEVPVAAEWVAVRTEVVVAAEVELSLEQAAVAVVVPAAAFDNRSHYRIL